MKCHSQQYQWSPELSELKENARKKNGGNTKQTFLLNNGSSEAKSSSRRQQSQDSFFSSPSPNVSVSSPDSYWYTTATTSSPFIVYRSAKYDRPHARVLQTCRSYAKYYVVTPLVLFANQCKDAFYQLGGLLLFLVASPFWLLMILGLVIVRRLRLHLISRFYPDLISLNSATPQSASASSEDSLNIVNSLIWTKGRVDPSVIKNRFQLIFAENPQVARILRLRKSSRFGAVLWESDPDDDIQFQLDNHILEAPKHFHGCPIIDEPVKELYRNGPNNKTILQKFVSYLTSVPLERSTPPWRIHVVPYISRDDGLLREKTCLVVRMHVTLITLPEVQRALRELFLNSAGNVNNHLTEASSEDPIDLIDYHDDKFAMMRMSSWRMRWQSLQKCLGIWLNLRLKQLEFHSKTVVLSLLIKDFKDNLKRFLVSSEDLLAKIWGHVCDLVLDAVVKLQALAYVPVVVLLSLLRRAQFKQLGLQKNSQDKKLISWSDLLHQDLIEEICNKAGIKSKENVILMACSYALHDYYQQNNMPNPRYLGFAVENTFNTLNQEGKDLKAISVPCDVKRCPGGSGTLQKFKKLENDVQNYPVWKSLGLWYTSKYAYTLLPNFLARKLRKCLISCYPFSFTYTNSNPNTENGQDLPIPTRQLYGDLVEGFTLWPLPPMSDHGISIVLVQYTGKTRLFVMSPFQQLDTILTHRCNQYLIKLAEDVGVERNKIPYSRRTSPNSTLCSTPQPQPFVNTVDNLQDCRMRFKRSESLNIRSTH